MKLISIRQRDTSDEDGDDTRVRVATFRASKRETDRILRDSRERARVHEHLVDTDVLAPNGCDCYHCQMDWDCCGNFFTYGATYARTRRGFTATQHFQRNV